MSRDEYPITDETLMGYLLMALPDEEQWHIDSLAMRDPDLAQRIEDLRCLLHPAQELNESFEPRGDLTDSTLAFIQEATTSQSPEYCAEKCDILKMSPQLALSEASRATRLAWLDSLVALAAGIVILSVLLPSVWFSREASRRIACSANMRQLGQALFAFANNGPNRQLPKIDIDGPFTFAGVYAVRLKEAGLLDSPRWTWCPASNPIDANLCIPSVKMYLEGSYIQQANWRKTAGGSYSYNLGNVINRTYQTPAVGSGYVAVIGDTMLSNKSGDIQQIVHGGNTANILYDDGRVQLVRVYPLEAAPLLDNPYRNKASQQAVGFGHDDSCLGPSFQYPFIDLKLE